MSISCEGYIGYTVNLKTNLQSNDFDFFWDFREKYSEYNLYDCKGKVSIIVDGMSGEYSRLIFVDEHIEECWVAGKSYYKLREQESIPEHIYNELNTAYNLMYNKTLDPSMIEYAAWFHFA